MSNAADSGQVRKAEKREKILRRRESDDVKYVLGSQQGRRLLWKYLCEAGVYKTTFTGNSTTYFNEGRRSLGLQILTDIDEECPELYLLMKQEAKENENVD